MNIHIVAKENSTEMDNIIVDEKGFLFQKYKIKQQTIYIVRPDFYIAYYSSGIDLPSIDVFLKQYLLT